MAVMESKPRKRGWLYKTGKFSDDQWKRRWFVLEDQQLRYYDSDKVRGVL